MGEFVLWHTLQNAAGMFKNETFLEAHYQQILFAEKKFFFLKGPLAKVVVSAAACG